MGSIRKTSKISKIFSLLILSFILAACGGDDNDKNGRQPTATKTTPNARVIVSQAPVFTLPSREAEVIVNLFEGEARDVIGKSSADEFGTVYYQVNLGNRMGWILESQVEVSGDANLIALVPATSTPTSTSEPITEIATEISQETAATPQSLPTETNQVTAVISVARAIALTAPYRDAPELTTLLQGEQVKVLRQTLPDAIGTIFYEVELGTQRGWVLSTQVQVSGDVNTLGIAFVPTPARTTETPEAGAGGITSEPTTAVPTNTPTSTPTATDELVITPSATQENVTLEPSPVLPENPSIRAGEPPPINIDFPEGWQAAHVIVPMTGYAAAGDIKMSVYEGPLSEDGLKGYIWLIWGDFPNIFSYTDINPDRSVDGILWSNGIQFMRGLLFQGCNIGFYADNRQTYLMDGYEGEGTTFSAVSCEDGASDVGGWWVGVRVNEENFLFYMGVEPIDRVADGLNALRPIIDTLQFTE